MKPIQKRPILLIRVDASATIGTGHFMRSFAVAQAAISTAKAHIIFITGSIGEDFTTLLRDQHVEHKVHAALPGSKEDAEFTSLICEDTKPSCLLLDGYHFGEVYLASLKKQNFPVALFDDFTHLKDYPVDFLINYNLHACSKDYRVEKKTRLLLGPQFAPLREEFIKIKREIRPTSEKVKKILITFGGSDPLNVTAKAVESVLDLPGVSVTVLVGAMNPYLTHLKSLIENKAHFEVLHKTGHIAELMKHSDLAISAAGSTVWELAYMGVPSVILITANNQEAIATSLEKSEIALNLGDQAKVSRLEIKTAVEKLTENFSKRALMSKKSQQVVDGKGGLRIVETLLV